MRNALDKKLDEWNKFFQEKRHYFFTPILKILSYLGFSANILSHFKVFVGVLVYYVSFKDLQNAFFILLFAFLIDLFDGALARFQKTTSDRGKFIDIFTDWSVYCLIIFALVQNTVLSSVILFYHLTLLSILYLVVVLYKNEFSPSDWIITPIARLSYYKVFFLIPLYLTVFSLIERTFFYKIVFILNILISVHFIWIYCLFISKRLEKK